MASVLSGSLLILLCFAGIQTCFASGSAEVPLGHMLPLGSHAKPDPVEERFDIPSAEEFMKDYVIPSKPVVFRGILKDSPMFKLWTDEHVKKNYPDLELRLEAKTEKEGYVPSGAIGMGRDTFKNFIETYHDTNKYVVSELPTPTWHEVYLPSFMTCGPVHKNFVEIDLWMSGGNTSSLLHKDAFNALNCLFNGTKEWKLFEFKYEKELYKAYEPGQPLGGFSRINPEAVDMTKYPKVATVPWTLTTVQKGDCLFLPKSMYHQVKSYGTMNTAVAFLFSRFDSIKANRTKFDDCPSQPLPLSEIDVDWQYPGKGMMYMGYSELRSIRRGLYRLPAMTEKDTFKNILQAVENNDYHPIPTKEKAETLVRILKNGDPNVKITRKLIKSLPRSAIREAAYLTEPLLPSNTYDYEYFQISPREIAELLSILLKKNNGIVTREDFVGQYQERLWGSEMFGNSIFDDLAGKGEMKVGSDDIRKNFQSAAKKFDRVEKENGGNEQEEIEEGEDKTDDAYLGRNIDLDEEKDKDTLATLASQIINGGFVDKERSYRADEEGEEDNDDEPQEEDEDAEEEGSDNGENGEQSSDKDEGPKEEPSEDSTKTESNRGTTSKDEL